MSEPRTELSVVTDSGSDHASSCGYCGGDDQWYSHGMPCRNLTVYAYQDLIDQGWRRSGRYLYKPDLARSCCKAYTIRLDVQRFSPDKAQRRLVRKWREYLSGSGSTTTPAAPSASASPQVVAPPPPGPTAAAQGEELQPAAPDGDEGPLLAVLRQLLSAALAAAVACGELPPADPPAYPAPTVRRCTASAKQRAALPADVQYTSAAAFAIAAAAAKAARAAGAGTGRAGGPGAGGMAVASTATDCQVGCAAAVEGTDRALPTVRGEGSDGGAGSSTAGKDGAQRRRKQQEAGAAAGGLTVDVVAAALARHFNEAAAAAALTGGTAAGHVGGGAGQGSDGPAAWAGGQEGAAVGSGPGADMSSTTPSAFGLARPEAYAANGHINIRVGRTGEAAPVERQGQSGCGRGSSLEAGGQPAAAAAASEAVSGAGLVAGQDPGAPEGHGPKGKATTSSRRRTKRRAMDPGGEGRCAGGHANTAAGADAGGPCGGSMDGIGAHRQPRGLSAGGPSGAPALGSGGAREEALWVPEGRLEVRLVRSAFLEEEFQLYVRYQAAQHGDDPSHLSRDTYTRFLVDSPLRPVGRDEDPQAPECGYGSFHQQYWLDGELVAVGVVDILPRCLSSVYLFWEPSLPSLALGRFSALQEIRWVQRHAGASPGLHYYYMGFYIHTCAKMRYKAEYAPSDLLCPMRRVWVRITPELLAAIDRSPYLALSREEGALCQPNLAAPPGDPASLQAAAAAAPAADAGAASGGQVAAAAGSLGGAGGSGLGRGPGDTGEAAVEGDVGDTLILLRTRAGPLGPITWEEAVTMIQERYMATVEQAIRTWREAVGWAAPALVYQL